MRYARFRISAGDRHGFVEGDEVVDLGPAPAEFSLPPADASGPRRALADVTLLAPVARPEPRDRRTREPGVVSA